MMDFLTGVSIDELKERIENFRLLDIKTLTDNELSSKLQKIFAVNIGDEAFIEHHFNKVGVNLPSGCRFYRIRKIKSIDDLKTEQDFWNPLCPKEGRLNQDGRPVLYTCIEPNPIYTAMNEASILDNELFAIISYSSVVSIHLQIIGELRDITNHVGWADTSKIKHQLIDDFLKTEFTYNDAGKMAENYRLSRTIARYFGFDTNLSEVLDGLSDGAIYPSVKTKLLNNVCLYPHNAKSKLQLLGAAICVANDESFEVEKIAQRLLGQTIISTPTSELVSEILYCYKNYI